MFFHKSLPHFICYVHFHREIGSCDMTFVIFRYSCLRWVAKIVYQSKIKEGNEEHVSSDYGYLFLLLRFFIFSDLTSILHKDDGSLAATSGWCILIHEAHFISFNVDWTKILVPAFAVKRGIKPLHINLLRAPLIAIFGFIDQASILDDWFFHWVDSKTVWNNSSYVAVRTREHQFFHLKGSMDALYRRVAQTCDSEVTRMEPRDRFELAVAPVDLHHRKHRYRKHREN